METPFDMLVDISYACADFAERAGHTKMPRHEALFTQLSSRAMSIVATFKTTLDTLAAISQSDGGRALPALRKAMDSLATRMPPEIVEAERIARESKLAKVEHAQTTEVPAEVVEGDLAVGGLGEFAPEVRRARQIAEQLDEIILPTSREGLDHEEFKRRLRQVADDAAREAGPGASGKIAWLRLGDLAALCDVFDGRLFRSKPQSLGGGPPYFVCMFTYRGTRYGVAESPVVGNATYTVSEFHSAMSVLDVLTLTRAEARRFNAERRTHRPTLPYGPERVDELAYAVMQMAEEEAAGQRRPIAIPRGYRLVNDANATR
jgi:hypothetical protein